MYSTSLEEEEDFLLLEKVVNDGWEHNVLKLVKEEKDCVERLLVDEEEVVDDAGWSWNVMELFCFNDNDATELSTFFLNLNFCDLTHY